jgi:hypothetical protein
MYKRRTCDSIQKPIPAIVVRLQHAADVSQYRTRPNITPAAASVESGARGSDVPTSEPV